MSLATAQRRGPGLAEVYAVWALFGAVTLAVLVTYARLPASELYHVSGEGLGAGAGRALVFVDFPVALAAVAVLPVLRERLPGRWPLFAALLSGVLCATVAWPRLVDEHDLDARPVNALPAIGVAIALALTAAASRRPGPRSVRRAYGDRVRIALASALAVVAVPWVAAELGVGFSHVPVLGDVFQSDEHYAPLGEARVHAAVHAGTHHGMHGVLFVATALLLSRALPELRSPGRRSALSLYLALLAAYGLGNVLNDAWLEQVVKRGWAEREIPSVLNPAPTRAWLVVLAGAAVAHVGVLRRLPPAVGVEAAATRRGPAFGAAAAGAAAVVALAAVGAGSRASELAAPAAPPLGRIAFVTVGQRFDVFLLGHGGDVRNLTGHQGRDLAPAWSADGRRLAFQSDRDGEPAIYSMAADGRSVEPVTAGSTAGEPAWRAGGQLVFVCEGELCVTTPTGVVRVDVERADPRWPAAAPDGSAFAFEANGKGGRDLYLLEAETQRLLRLVGGPSDDRFPRWSPDGRRLAFVSDRAGDFDVWIARADGSAPRRLTDGRGDDFAPAWAPDGRWLAFVSNREGRDQLYAVRVDGTGLRRLTSGDTDKETPSWGR